MNDPEEHSDVLDIWTDRAACKGRTDLFFVNRGDTTRMNKAKAICQTCPVIGNCRDYVTYNPERFGIWAGMTEKDRRLYRIQQGIKLPSAQHGTRLRYNSGCRCLDCRSCNARFRAEWNKR